MPEPTIAELVDVPFFPQTEYDCGPASLATLLGAAQVPVTPSELIDAVYIEGLNGSLQAELLAATRRYGLLPVPLEPDWNSLVTEIAGGRPVLVLQNLALEHRPVWHYAVVVGFENDYVVLRSGDQRRRLVRFRPFMRSWRLAEHWGFVAVRPGEIPASTTPGTFMRALVGSERQLGVTSAAASYASAIERWPNDPLVLFLGAAADQTTGDVARAVERYRKLLSIEPAHVAARNNLANALLEQGCRTAALQQARMALGQQSPDDGFHAAITDTLRHIEVSPAAAEPAVCTAI